MSGLWRTKSVEQSIQDTDEPGHKLKRSLSAWDLTVFGVAVVIGAGIFTLTARVAATTAGPAVSISFVIAAIACGLAAMCYAEFASTVPVAGSAYTFSYATLGELIAWIIGWDLVLELALGASVVSKGWSLYLGNLFTQFGGSLETTIELGPINFDWGAVLIVAVITWILVLGTKLSARANMVITSIKVAVVLLVIIVGFFYFNAANLSPFIPPSRTGARRGRRQSGLEQPLLQLVTGAEPSSFGVFGILAAASLVFFAFIGFDVVATAAEETQQPQAGPAPRHLRLAGDRHRAVRAGHDRADRDGAVQPVRPAAAGRHVTTATRPPWPTAFTAVGVDWAANVIAIGALAGLTTVVLVLMLGQSRIIFAMSRDGLLPRGMAKVNEKRGTPARITIGVGVGRRAHRRVLRHQRARGDGQRRHAVRVRPGVHRGRRAAQDPARSGAVLQGAVDAGGADPVGARLPVADDQPHRDHLGPVPGLDGDRRRRLLRLRQAALAGPAPGR